MELPRRKRAKKIKYMDLYPQGIIEIIQTYYPDRYKNVSENLETLLSLEKLFSQEEWIDILSKSRLSYEQWIKLKKLRIRTVKF
jgi:hypothetical protein